MPKVKVYTMENCPFCVAAKALLEQRAISYEEVLLAEDDDASWDALYRKSGLKTVPQIFVGDRLVGGFRELSEEDRKDSLAGLRDNV